MLQTISNYYHVAVNTAQQFVENPQVRSKAADIFSKTVTKRNAFYLATGIGLCLLQIYRHSILPFRILNENAIIVLLIRRKLNQWFPSLESQAWYHEILKNKLVLGAMPLETCGHVEELKSMNVGAVLAIIDDREANESGLFHTPVKEKKWEEKDIQYLRINLSDQLPLSIEQLNKVTKWIEEQIETGNRKVYVHCRAGKGRSATVVVAYIMKKYSWNFDRAYKKVVEDRPVVSCNASQIQCLKEFEKTLTL